MSQDAHDLTALLDEAEVIGNPSCRVAGIAGGDEVAAFVHELHGRVVATVQGLKVRARCTVFTADDLGRGVRAALGDSGLDAALFVLDGLKGFGKFRVHTGFLAFVVVSGFGHVSVGVGAALVCDLRGLIRGPRHHRRFQQAHALAVCYTVLVGF